MGCGKSTVKDAENPTKVTRNKRPKKTFAIGANELVRNQQGVKILNNYFMTNKVFGKGRHGFVTEAHHRKSG